MVVILNFIPDRCGYALVSQQGLERFDLPVNRCSFDHYPYLGFDGLYPVQADNNDGVNANAIVSDWYWSRRASGETLSK